MSANSDTKHNVALISELTASGIKHTQSEAQNEQSIHELDASKLSITKTTSLRTVPELNSKEVWSFKECTDHMLKVTWTSDQGW